MCVNQGGALLSVMDPQESVFIQQNIDLLKDSAPSFWIGLYKNHDGKGGEHNGTLNLVVLVGGGVIKPLQCNPKKKLPSGPR